MFALLITAVPLINLVMVPILAFSGTSQTKKNYYRAILVWIIVMISLHLLVLSLGAWPTIIKQVADFWKYL